MHMKSSILRGAALLLSVLMLLSSAVGCGKKAEPEPEPQNNGLDLGYAVDGVMEVQDSSSLQAAVDEMFSKQSEPFVLEYKETATSKNGVDFDCYIANAKENSYDLFITLYGDSAQTDELFKSQLLRPGTSFRTITLNHALNPGTHTVYLLFTQVEENDGVFSVHNELNVSLTFTVLQP